MKGLQQPTKPSREAASFERGRRLCGVHLSLTHTQGLAGLSGSSLFLFPLKPEGAEQAPCKLPAGHSEVSGETPGDSGTMPFVSHILAHRQESSGQFGKADTTDARGRD